MRKSNSGVMKLGFPLLAFGITMATLCGRPSKTDNASEPSQADPAPVGREIIIQKDTIAENNGQSIADFNYEQMIKEGLTEIEPPLKLFTGNYAAMAKEISDAVEKEKRHEAIRSKYRLSGMMPTRVIEMPTNGMKPN